MNMNKKLIAAVAAGIIGAGGFAQVASAATGNANAVIVAPISFTENTQLNFGTIQNGQAAGSGTTANVVVNNDGVTATTYGTNLAKVGATDARGQFTLNGGASLAYTLTLPASATITGGTTGDTMTVSSFNSRTGAGAGLTGTLSAGGSDTVYIGATLTVKDMSAGGGGSRADTYTGTYTITAAYN